MTVSKFFMLAILLVSTSAAGAEEAPEPPLERHRLPVVRALVPVVEVAPEFPPDAPPDLEEGWVLIEFTLTDEGGVRDPRVIRSSDPVLEAAALRAVRQWKFRPREKDGVPVATKGEKTVVMFDRKPPPPLMPVPLPSGDFALVYSLQSITPVPPTGVSESGKGGRDGSDIGPTEFRCEVVLPPGQQTEKKAAAAAKYLTAHIVDGVLEDHRAEYGGERIDAGTVRILDGVPDAPPGSDYVPPGLWEFRFERGDDGEWERAT